MNTARQLWQYNVGGCQMGGFLSMVELTQEGSVNYCHVHPHLLYHLLQLLVKAGLLVAHPGLGHLSVRYLE